MKAYRALVTGATGYLGSHVTHALVRAGWDVRLLCRPQSSLAPLESLRGRLEVHIDGGGAQSLRPVFDGLDAVFHLAALFLPDGSARNAEEMLQANVAFGCRVLEGMRESGVRHLAAASTAWQYANGAAYTPYTFYTATKQAFEDMAAHYSLAHGMRICCLRLPDIYGPGDTRGKILNLIARCARTGEPLDMSPGEQEMDLLYAEDAAGGFMAAARLLMEGRGDPFRGYALTSGEGVPLRDIVGVFERENRVRCPIRWGALPYRPHEIFRVAAPEAVLPGWKPQVPLREGLRRFYMGKGLF